MSLNSQTLVYKTKDELLDIVQEAIDTARDGEADEVYSAVEDIEQVAYVLRNCEYEGRKENE